MHPSFPVRRIFWRPSYQCEIAIVSNAEFGTGSIPDISQAPLMGAPGGLSRVGSNLTVDRMVNDGLYGSSGRERGKGGTLTPSNKTSSAGLGDAVEIWDVRRGWIAKWCVDGSAIDGGVTGLYNHINRLSVSHYLGHRHCIWRFSCDLGCTLVGYVLSNRSSRLHKAFGGSPTHGCLLGCYRLSGLRDRSCCSMGDAL